MTSNNRPIVLHAAEEESAAYLAIRLASDPTFRDKAVFVAETFAEAKKAFEILERWWYLYPVTTSLGDGRKRDAGPRRDIDLCDFITPAGGRLVFMGVEALSRKLPYLAQVAVIISEEWAAMAELNLYLQQVRSASEQSIAERFAGTHS